MNKMTLCERIKQKEFALIAEIGVNYYDIANKLRISLMEAAKFMILSAYNAGVHAVKFQTYKAETLASKESPYYWDIEEEPTQSQYELFKKFDRFEEKDYIELSRFCGQIGIEFCSTPFDFASVDYLEPLMNVYKIASSDITNLPFIEYIAQKQKPILLSVGASNKEEIHQAVTSIRRYNQKEVVLLHCVLEYPTSYGHANLDRISALKKEFPDMYIGYSDHTKPDVSFDVIKTAYLLGANIVEKHFTVDKTLQGNDHYHAMDADDVKKIIREMEFLHEIRGKGRLNYLESEETARKNARRSIIASRNLPKGSILKRDMLVFKRPGTGISPNEIEKLLGKRTVVCIKEDEVIRWDMIEDTSCSFSLGKSE